MFPPSSSFCRLKLLACCVLVAGLSSKVQAQDYYSLRYVQSASVTLSVSSDAQELALGQNFQAATQSRLRTVGMTVVEYENSDPYRPQLEIAIDAFNVGNGQVMWKLTLRLYRVYEILARSPEEMNLRMKNVVWQRERFSLNRRERTALELEKARAQLVEEFIGDIKKANPSFVDVEWASSRE